MTSTLSFQVTALSKSYGKERALDNLSFEAASDRIIGFLGPNGAGKSTTMKMLTGILPIVEGQCLIAGIDMRKDPLSVKRILGYLPENNPLYETMYVQEILAFEARIHHLLAAKTRIAEVIALTGLQQEQHKKISELSKGYKQRVGLAMAILHDPQILILDEPTSGLDPNQILEIRALIKKLSQNKTVLFSTHIMQEAEAICDEIIILNKGKLQDHFLVSEAKTKYPNQTLEDIFVQLTKN